MKHIVSCNNGWLYVLHFFVSSQVINGTGTWLSLDAELVMRDGQVVGTKTATGHALLIDARFELPYGKWEKYINTFFTFQSHPT